ncbi:hypothetical protein [Bdellovibrio sp. HCB337]|uniref:hypothetical protein n=1 Tax=Bdellovibrio sp. HCB337 TaxID=3394358 RepID=UPI0039A6662E
MRNVSSVATSQTSGAPWTAINRDNARTQCQNLGAGYNLISNAQWQTIARNIADTDSNWSTGTAYSGQLNRGHSDNAPSSGLSASTDSDACSGTGQTCSDVTWHDQRRTHKLSNGETIWDFSGNALEWVLDTNGASQGAQGWAASFNGGDSRQNNYGNDQFCGTPGSSPYCGYGYGWTAAAGGAVRRGGYWGHTTEAGIFESDLTCSASCSDAFMGFRCIYVN